MKNVVVIGDGVTGKAVCRFFQRRGIEPKVVNAYTEGDIVVKSPGIRLDHPGVIDELELGLPLAKKAVGITGSNGKTTVTLLVAHVTGGIACGNIGTPVVDVVDKPHELLVVEVSSFQLHTLNIGPYFDAAAILNITENHLDWHASFEEYRKDKMKLAQCMKKGAKCFMPPFICLESLLQQEYRGSVACHDRENIAAAFAICQSLGVSKERFLERLSTFKKPPHRMEWVASKEGVDFVNDSKATSVDAAVKGIAAAKGKVILLAGGVDKGGSFHKLLESGKVRQVLAFGQAALRIEEELKDAVPVCVVPSLEEGVKKACQMAKKEESVLLSPACASFDQFRSFEERGEMFREYVRRGVR